MQCFKTVAKDKAIHLINNQNLICYYLLHSTILAGIVLLLLL